LIAVVSCEHNPRDERIYEKEIESLLKVGYSINYYTKSNVEVDLSKDRLKHTNISIGNINEYIKRLKVVFRQHPPTVLHIHEFQLLTLASWCKQKWKSKIIYDVHDTLMPMWNTFSTRNGIFKLVINYWLSFSEKRFLKYVDKLIIANPSSIIYYQTKVSNIVLVENFPVRDRVNESIEQKKNKAEIIIFHGEISEDRGISILVEAFQSLVKKFPNVVLNIIGPWRNKYYEKDIREKITLMNLNKNVLIYPELTSERIWECLYQADIGILPYIETPRTLSDVPTRLFEYFASGCAVIASRLPPIEMYGDKIPSYAIPGNKDSLIRSLTELLTQPELRKKMISIGKNKILTEYNWSKIEGKLLDIYEDICGVN